MSYQTAAHCVGHKYKSAFERVYEWTHDRSTTEEMAFQEARYTASLLRPVDVSSLVEEAGEVIIYRFTDGSAATLRHSGVSVCAEVVNG